MMPVELDDAMALLELEEYANDLERQGHGKRLLQLHAVKEELRYPYLDLRKPLEPPDEKEMFTAITGETDHTLYVGLKTGCTVTKIFDEVDGRTDRRRQRAFVRTDSGLRGSIRCVVAFGGSARGEGVAEGVEGLPTVFIPLPPPPPLPHSPWPLRPLCHPSACTSAWTTA